MDSGLIGAILSLENDRERRPEIPFYREGTWTPSFAGSGVAGSFTYSQQIGYYTQIGNLIFIRGFVGISAIAVAPTADMVIGGLPFTAANIAAVRGALCFSEISNINYTAAALALTGEITENESFVRLYEVFDNTAVAAYPAGNFTNAAARLVFTGQYQIS
jgi:hypothetical protein